MRPGVIVTVTSADRRRLAALARNRNAAQKHVWRAQIVLLSAAGMGTNEIMRRTAKSKTCVWRWQERFAQEGYHGLLRDKTRRARIAPLAAAVAERVVALTRTNPPVEATHWTAAMMAKAVGISASSVQTGKAINPADRANWRKLAEGWQRMATNDTPAPFRVAVADYDPVP